MDGKERVKFGIRHLSAGGAHHLRLFLEEIRPTAVLIEGPADAEGEFAALVSPETRPPVAILAHTTELPVRTILYPFAVYSPEYAALAWAAAHGVPARFIDLPSDILLALEYGRSREDAAEPAPEADLALGRMLQHQAITQLLLQISVLSVTILNGSS
ncbi:MAG: DUF5682 family protein [Bacillota bacterium]